MAEFRESRTLEKSLGISEFIIFMQKYILYDRYQRHQGLHRYQGSQGIHGDQGYQVHQGFDG